MNDKMEELQNQVVELTERVSTIENRLDGEENLSVTDGIREFVESFDPSSHTERSLYIAYYLEKYCEKETFSVKDIEEAYRDCRVNPANNMSDVLGRMENRDWLFRDGTEGQTQLWRLTASGLDTVTEEIDDES